MTWVSTMFHQGGPTMFWIEYLAVPAVVIGVLSIVSLASWARWVTMALTIAILGCGVYGTVHNQHLLDDALAREAAETPPSPYLAEMRDQGAVEAKRPIEFAGIVVGGVAVLIAIGELRRRAKR